MNSILNSLLSSRVVSLGTKRCYSLRIRKSPKIVHPEYKFESKAESLAARGFLRSIKAYDPPADAGDKVLAACTKLGIPTDPNHTLNDPKLRFSLLTELFNEFRHSVPNSLLNKIDTIGDVIGFYETPVDTRTPLDSLKTMDLPKNLHVQYEYIRFHPDTDTKFGGVSAFPQSGTLVTGLKYRKKYPGYAVKPHWH